MFNMFKFKIEDRVLGTDEKWEAGIQKKSFLLNYNNGVIWCEHLDSMGEYRAKVLEKYGRDLVQFSRIDMPTAVAVILDETILDEEILTTILNGLVNTKQVLRKVAFVGMNHKDKNILFRIIRGREDIHFIINVINDLEKAKEWLV